MKKLLISEIVEAIEGNLVSGPNDMAISRVSTDSRTVEAGDLFIPLIGENHDAHDYIDQVLERGCKAIIISDVSKINIEKYLAGEANDVAVIFAEDTLIALQNLAKYYMALLPVKKKIAVTGSVGKTSTRDMLYAVAATKYKTAKSIKNFNNAFGLPMSIFEFPEDTEIAILEMGMSTQGSIEKLAELARPDMAVLTNIGISHIENFPEEGRMGILKTKLGVTKYFDENSVLVINTDNDLLTKKNTCGEYKLVTCGSKGFQDYKVSKIVDRGDKGISFNLKHNGVKYSIDLDIPGAHNAVNASLAIAIGEELGISVEDAVIGLKQAQITEKRLSIKTTERGIKIIDDTYNAAPDSVKSALNTLKATEGSRHIAILGDMFELGSETENGHRDVGRYAKKLKLDRILAIGESAEWIKEEAGSKAEYFPDKKEVIEHINEHLQPRDVVLIKASRGMHLEEIVKIIK